MRENNTFSKQTVIERHLSSVSIINFVMNIFYINFAGQTQRFLDIIYKTRIIYPTFLIYSSKPWYFVSIFLYKAPCLHGKNYHHSICSVHEKLDKRTWYPAHITFIFHTALQPLFTLGAIRTSNTTHKNKIEKLDLHANNINMAVAVMLLGDLLQHPVTPVQKAAKMATNAMMNNAIIDLPMSESKNNVS